MDHLLLSYTLFILISLSSFSGVEPITFKFINKCRHTIWPGLLSGAGTAQLPTTGFYLSSGKSRAVKIPISWSGRVWVGPFAPRFDWKIFMCHLDGYNLPMLVIPKKVTRGGCGATGCLIDLNGACPKELKLSAAAGGGKGAVACRSACEAFGDPRFCCSEGYATPDTCGPSVYSLFFKHACPRSYSYAYDDKTSTYNCAGTDYDIIFCPLLIPGNLMYFILKLQPEIAGTAKRWGGAPTCEQDDDVPTKPRFFISRCGSTSISCRCSLHCYGTFALLATFIAPVTNFGWSLSGR
uniref:Thaumatin-like protein n=1 Tax=Salix viminalis TaxID=40686 RepID=A0A6N2L5I8_SALVM